MKKRLQALRNEDGLTLVELLAVIVILAIVSVIAFVMISQVIENSKKDAHVANALQMINGAKLYEANGLFDEDVAEQTATLGDIQDSGFIGDIIEPWKKENMTELTSNKVVRKKAAGSGEITYEVTLISADSANCSVTGETEVSLANDGRKVCSTSTGD